MTIALLASVEARMRSSVGAEQNGNPVSNAAHYHLAAGGSRVRASLCVDASLALGVDPADTVTLAAICELLHNASLIQDDLLDRAALRRSLPSVWSAFDDGTAVCAGDLLLANAFALIGELRCAEHVVPVLSLVHRRTREVILGQGDEQSAIPKTVEGYERVAIGKSGSLLSLPLELPLLVSGRSEFMARARSVSERFATAYQMVDDLADYEEDVRNGSLNVVSVAQSQHSLDYPSACEFVCSRAETLIAQAIQGVAEMPQRSGACLTAYAEQLRVPLRAWRAMEMHSLEPSHHGK